MYRTNAPDSIPWYMPKLATRSIALARYKTVAQPIGHGGPNTSVFLATYYVPKTRYPRFTLLVWNFYCKRFGAYLVSVST